MKIVDQSHEIVALSSILNIELAGRTCYKSEDRITPDSADAFAKMICRRRHDAMLEHGFATVRFITNRGVTHELVRHRLCSFGQESTRFVNYKSHDIQFIRPVWIPADVMVDVLSGAKPASAPASKEFLWGQSFVCDCEYAEQAYKRNISYGQRPEQARGCLPNDLKTEIVVTANFREWRHIFNLRALGTTGKPHPQMQALMLPALKDFAFRCPALFKDLLLDTHTISVEV